MQRSGAGVGEHNQSLEINRAASGLLQLTKFFASPKPMLSGLRHKIIAVAVLAALAPAWTASVFARRTADANGAISAGTITNRAESIYEDSTGTKYSAVSQTVSVTVLAVSALVVTPDESESSATVTPNERITRLFPVCNSGNIPDTYTITRAEASAPAQIVSLYFDIDKSGTVSDGDTLVRAGEGVSPQLARGACVGLLAVVDTNAVESGSRLSISVTARSNAVGATNGAAEDAGTIINAVGHGVRFSAPDDPRLAPVKLVNERDRVTTAHGQTLTYRITFRNSGDTPARRTLVADELPAGLDYVANSLRLDGRALTDAEDADEGRVVDRRVEVRLAEVAVGALVEITLQARASSGIAPGGGIVNTAIISADNSSSVATSEAIAIINPFGLVYEGRSGSTVAGARIQLLTDSQTGTPLTLPSASGSTPNEGNINPFTTDAQGRWSFALAPAQFGTALSPARYYLNVTAPGFRARMIEVTLTPLASAGGTLFALAVRALDGQPVSRGGNSFELTNGSVLIESLAALALNVPLFETSTLEIVKGVDRASAEVGDVISYRVEVRNATSAAVDNVVVRDTLPTSFHYAPGSARVDTAPEAARAVEPEVSGGEMVFRLGQLRAGARATITYRVRIGVNARDGEQVNTAVATGTFTSGEVVATAPARAPVRVRRGVFSTRQIIVGRVFEDANANGMFDRSERPVAGVRLYLANGHSVSTDSAGLYNFPSVGDGAQVISLDPVTLPAGYALTEAQTRDARSWTRLLRTPLGGGALLRQNFALRPAKKQRGKETLSESTTPNPGRADATGAKNVGAGLVPARVAPAEERPETSPAPTNSSGVSTIKASAKTTAQQDALAKASPGDKKPAAPPAGPGTYEVAATETIEPIAPGAVRVVSPAPGAVIAGAALEVEAQVAEGWTVALEVGGARVPESNIGERRVDHKNKVSTFTYVAINVQPGPNRVRVTAISPAGKSEGSVDLTAYGRGPAKRLEVTTAKSALSAGGRDSTTVRVRAYDEWGHPAADASVAVEASAGRLLPTEGQTPPQVPALTGAGTDATKGVVSEQVTDTTRQHLVQLTGGEGTVQFIADNAAGEAEIRASAGRVEAQTEVRITPEERAPILVGLAEMSVGRAAPEITLSGEDTSARSRVAFFYRGQVFGKNLLTLAYDSRRALNRTAANDRLFQLDPLERAYPLFGDSSTRYEDAQSNSKLYARLDRGRSFFMFGDFETEHKETTLMTYSRKLTGVKVHLENSRGDFISLTGARPDTAYARDVFPGGALPFASLSHFDVLPGSEVVTLEVRDRRNPEIIISREQFVRSVDYNLDAARGEIFFLRPVSAFDYALNLVQVVVTYEHRATGMSSAVYTGRAVKNFEKLGLRLGLSLINQRQADLGSFFLGGFDGEQKLPRGGKLKFEWATSRGRVMAGGNVFDTAGDGEHDGNAYRVELHQPLSFKEGILKAEFARADEGFLNPFGGTVTPGSQRASVAVDMKARPSSVVRFGLMDERNRTANVDNERVTASIDWAETLTDRLRVNFGYDLRRLTDDFNDTETTSNLVTVGAEWQATDKLQLSVTREQNLGEADPTYPNLTTFSANYKWNSWTRVFLTQRLASAPIVPISDTAATGFASSGARRETAIGVETKLGRYTSLASRYQIENGINGTDSFAVIGLTNRLPVTKKLSLDLGYERGFHLAGEGESFNSATVGFAWQPTENFRTSGRYELRDRHGLGHVLTFGAAGRLADNLTSLVRVQTSRLSFNERDTEATNVSAALAWRPVESDRAGLLFSYTRRDVSQEGGAFSVGSVFRGATRDRADVISSDGYLQATKNLELYGRFALKFGDTTTPETPRASALTFMTQARAAYRLGRYFDLAGETRLLAQPSSGTRRASYGAEAGFWALADLRLGVGYNFTKETEPFGITSVNPRRGFYFTMSSKLSNLFDLFGTSREGLDAAGGGGATASTEGGKQEGK